ncbi:MAG: cellulase family glycosylhydrolase, partial [Armatimonadota bacterium]
VHPYRQEAPETAGADYPRLRELIAKYAPAGKKIPIVSGEWGYSLRYRHAGQFVSPELQAQFLVRQWLFNMAEGVPLSIWYDWHDDGPDPNEVEHNFGTVTYDYKPKPAYIAAQTLTRVLEGYTLRKRLETTSPSDYVLVFVKGSDVKLAAWTTGERHSIQIPAPADSAVAVSMLGNRSTVRAQGSGRSRTYTVELSGSPIYIELPGAARRKPWTK